jgi:uncharacterized protein YbjT (DUF2867 family)/uncharacterized protein YndB with AHSA1/START domain
VEVVAGDVLDPPSLERAAQGCRSAVYLVHSMNARKAAFAEADRQAARNMAAAAKAAGLQQIVYLGGLGDPSDRAISKHLVSRHEVGEILQAGAVPTTVLRAAMILGSGSASFEILRYLVERLPVMITPKWVHTPSQPIAITDVLGYIIGCLETPATVGGTFDIGGPDILSYKDLIDIFAEEAHLPPRRVIPVPVLTPALSARWIHLVTPVPASIAQPLTEGLSIPTTCRDHRIRELVPQRLVSCREAIRTALQRIAQEQVETCWMDAGELAAPEWAHCGDADYAGGTVLSCGYRVRIRAAPETVWQPVTRIGGRTGWYFADGLWRLRGAIDRLAGGVGLRRGRRHPSDLQVGEALDFWRVLEADPPQRLLLLAEMKLPGEALLDIRVEAAGAGRTDLTLHSRFLPRGLGGILYWYALYPFHEWIFIGMLKAIARRTGGAVEEGPVRFTSRLGASCSLPGGKI